MEKKEPPVSFIIIAHEITKRTPSHTGGYPFLCNKRSFISYVGIANIVINFSVYTKNLLIFYFIVKYYLSIIFPNILNILSFTNSEPVL